ncbi:unnamed protein product [Moneuplotes crassus]|uniref:Uncharacterized protein n=1 Tax=Euplotes crassus TaxID=5936 RepID=A0AAD2DD36_EUPCR|nr:unnamed protein product [Moneuplotes crassus]
MSIYNGFRTRALEDNYLQCFFKLCELVQFRLVCFYTRGFESQNTGPEEMDDQVIFAKILRYLRRMNKLESKKYLPPKFSKAFVDLWGYIDSRNVEISNSEISTTKNTFRNLTRSELFHKNARFGKKELSSHKIKQSFDSSCSNNRNSETLPNGDHYLASSSPMHLSYDDQKNTIDRAPHTSLMESIQENTRYKSKRNFKRSKVNKPTKIRLGSNILMKASCDTSSGQIPVQNNIVMPIMNCYSQCQYNINISKQRGASKSQLSGGMNVVEQVVRKSMESAEIQNRANKRRGETASGMRKYKTKSKEKYDKGDETEYGSDSRSNLRENKGYSKVKVKEKRGPLTISNASVRYKTRQSIPIKKDPVKKSVHYKMLRNEIRKSNDFEIKPLLNPEQAKKKNWKMQLIRDIESKPSSRPGFLRNDPKFININRNYNYKHKINVKNKRTPSSEELDNTIETQYSPKSLYH